MRYASTYVEPTTRFARRSSLLQGRTVHVADRRRVGDDPRMEGLDSLTPAGYHGMGIRAHVARTGGRSHV